MNIEIKIDELAVLNQQAKELEARIKMLKDEVIAECGEGKHRGVIYGVTVSLFNSNVVEYKKLVEELAVPQDVIARHTRQNAVIRVQSTN